MRLMVALLSLAFACPLTAAAGTMGDPDVAALQVALHSRALYSGSIDGLLGPRTTIAVRRLQKEHGLPASGSPGPLTRQALGKYARAPLGSRLLRPGMSGWDVAALQFLVAWHGFPSGDIDGVLGDHTERALLAYQAWAGVPTTGQAGPLTLAALQAPPPQCPIALSWPLDLPVGDPFGPRGSGFHPGIDIPAATGTPVQAAAQGLVVSAGFAPDGYGNRVVISHSEDVTTIYAHLSRVDAQVGQQISPGDEIGLVGATGEATGPHLHFEVRVRGAAVDPLPALQ